MIQTELNQISEAQAICVEDNNKSKKFNYPNSKAEVGK